MKTIKNKDILIYTTWMHAILVAMHIQVKCIKMILL